MNEISVRQAKENDAEELSLLICENAKVLLAPHYSQLQWDVFVTYYSSEALKEKIKTQVMFCAELDGKIVGTVALDNDFVLGFYTHTNYQRRGIGSLLMQHLETYAIEQNLREIQLAASPEGLQFYIKNGWEKVQDIVVAYYGIGFEETLMRKKL